MHIMLNKYMPLSLAEEVQKAMYLSEALSKIIKHQILQMLGDLTPFPP